MIILFGFLLLDFFFCCILMSRASARPTPKPEDL